MLNWQAIMILFLSTVSQILTAGIAITAFALLLYAMTFNLRDRVARSFALILLCIVVIYTAEAIGSTAAEPNQIGFWLRMQWVGILFLPGAYLHFSDALLATTGKPSRWRRYVAIRLVYLASLFLLALLVMGLFIGPVVLDAGPAPYLQPTIVTDIFILMYLVVMGMAWYNFGRSYRRTRTATSRRRMAYLVTGALAPAIGSFPFLLYSSTFASNHPLIFWILANAGNILVGAFIIVMAYAVAFFGVSWPDRVVKSRLFKWILRGPVMASFTLSIVTIVRRLGDIYGMPYTAMVPITMVGVILMGQYLITLFSPYWEKWLFFGNDHEDVNVLRNLEAHILTRNDLRQFLELVLAGVVDRLQAPGAYIAAMNGNGLELVVTMGKVTDRAGQVSEQLEEIAESAGDLSGMFLWEDDMLIPLYYPAGEDNRELLGVLGIPGLKPEELDEEGLQALNLLAERAALALHDRHNQTVILNSLQSLAPDIDFIERIRAAGRYDGQNILMKDVPEPPPDLVQQVKEALTHYWGGPKLTQSPLMRLRIVEQAMEIHEGNSANALRSILKEAIESVRPEGERRFTAEWILYNILELKFLEGRKVREVAIRLAMSEADLYRKQRVAIDAVAKAIQEMENQARNHVAS